MSKIYFECKVKYRKTTDTGVQKVVTVPFLVDALSYTEAESSINDNMKSYISEEFRVTNIRATNYAEVHNFENADNWFKSKVSLLAYNEETGREVKTNIFLLIQANDAKEAYENTIKAMKGTIGDYTIPSVSETAIIDVFGYVGQ